MVTSWEVPIGAAIAFAAGAIGTDGRSRGLVQPGPARLPRSPRLPGIIIVLEAIPETLVILGFVVASMIILMIQ